MPGVMLRKASEGRARCVFEAGGGGQRVPEGIRCKGEILGSRGKGIKGAKTWAV